MSFDANKLGGWAPPKHAEYVGPHTSKEPITITYVLNRATEIVSNTAEPHSREVHAFYHGADATDVTYARRHIERSNLKELEFHPHRRVIHATGTPEDLAKAFNIDFHNYRCLKTGNVFRTTSSRAELPSGVMAVLGLDNRPVAHPQIHKNAVALAPQDRLSSQNGFFVPTDVGKMYSFPDGLDGSGQTVAIIELGGGYTVSGVSQYLRELGVNMPATVDVSVLGGSNTTGSDADSEVQLDIEVAASLAPGAKFVMYFANNTDQGFFEAISQAAHDTTNKPSIISISWGGPEDTWGADAVKAMGSALEDAAKLGVTVFVAAGDNGATDGMQGGAYHCDFPASHPLCVSCGGTNIKAEGLSISLESVWDDLGTGGGATGGGISDLFARPFWQSGVIPSTIKSQNGVVGRGVPDVSGLGDPNTGYIITVNGNAQVVGGTSAVAPLWAALCARLNQGLGVSVSQLNQTVYNLPGGVFHDVTQGNNGGYNAGVGWDPTTGLGTPNGTNLLNALKQKRSNG